MADITLPSGEKDTTGDNNHLQDTPESSTKAELSPTREVLALFFSHLERFQFREAARILSLGAKHFHKNVWSVYPSLELLVVAESLYHSLAFLHMRKSYLQQLYETLSSEFNHAVGTLNNMKKSPSQRRARRLSSTPEGSPHFDFIARALSLTIPSPLEDTSFSPPLLDGLSVVSANFFVALFAQLARFLLIRKQLVLVYYQMAKVTKAENPYKDIVQKLKWLEKQLPVVLSHPLLLQIRQNVSCEIGMLQTLIRAQWCACRMKFEESLLHYELVDMEIRSWSKKFSYTDPVSFKTDDLSKNVPLFDFFRACRNCLEEKLRFYFGNQLLKVPHPFTGESACHIRTKKFFESSGCYNVSIIAEPSKYKIEKMGGIRLWNAVYTYPQPTPVIEHWPNIISLVLQHDEELNNDEDKPLYFADASVKSIYFIARIENRVLLVVVFVDNPVQSDNPVVTSFIKETLESLRYCTLLRRSDSLM